MRHLLVIICLLILTFPLLAKETGVLYLKKVNGKLGWFENGDDKKHWKYEGEIRNGLAHGLGTLTWTDGNKYEGEFKHGKLSGQGTLILTSGNKYEGEFKHGKLSGQGTYTWSDGDKYEGEFKEGKKHGQGKYIKPEVRKFVGEYKKGLKYGLGTVTYGKGKWEGDKYVGEFKEGKKHGRGKYSYSNGDKYEGEYKNGLKNGQGTITYGKGEFEGDKYEGEFKSNKFHGQGKYTYSNGDKYEGEFKGNKFHDQGKYTYSNGDKYEGEYENGLKNGQGTYTWNIGNKYVGNYTNGEIDGQGIYTLKSGRKGVGEFRKGKPWNVKSYDKNGKIEDEWVEGIKLKKVVQETGVLYLKKVNGKLGWFVSGNENKHWKYVGEIKKGEPNGTGVLSHPFGKYSGEVKNGIPHGQGTYTYKSGRKRVGEFRKAKPWNVISYDKNGKIEDEWVEGIKLKKEEIAPIEEKEQTENISYKIGVRVLLGSTSDESSSTSNTSLSLIWENYALGINQMSFKRTSSKNNVYEMNNSSLDLSYTLGLSYIIDWSATAGLGYVYEGKGAIFSGSTAIQYETESVSGFGLFGLLGIEWEDLEGLIGLRYYNVDYTGFVSTNTSEKLGIPYSTSAAQLIFGLGYKF